MIDPVEALNRMRVAPDYVSALREHPAFNDFARPAIAGISGGRTSALMYAALPDDVVFSFQNTGREHPATYEFLLRLQDAFKKPIIWLEYEPPPPAGRPMHASFSVVTPATADRTGKPFSSMLEALRLFRETKGKAPLAPWAKSRICTAYLKLRTQRKYVESMGWDTYSSFSGLRADEPHRVARMLANREDLNATYLCPLATADVTKQDVNTFWSTWGFDLQILGDYQGNCTGCFLKDEADLSRALGEDETDAQWWIDTQEKYGNFRPRGTPDYYQLRRELPFRLSVEQQLQNGFAPEDAPHTGIDDRRAKYLIRQEVKRFAEGATPFSCNCEGAEAIAAEDL